MQATLSLDLQASVLQFVVVNAFGLCHHTVVWMCLAFVFPVLFVRQEFSFFFFFLFVFFAETIGKA